jgi:thioredoxin 1
MAGKITCACSVAAIVIAVAANAVASDIAASNATTAAATQAMKLPRLLDLGATRCIPCKMMAPILEQLKKDYAARLEVEFIDVWKNPDAGNKYGIQIIPTQIFYNDSGKELFRHVGFYGRDDILAKWKELGIDLSSKPGPADSGKPSPVSSVDKTKQD